MRLGQCLAMDRLGRAVGRQGTQDFDRSPISLLGRLGLSQSRPDTAHAHAGPGRLEPHLRVTALQ